MKKPPHLIILLLLIFILPQACFSQVWKDDFDKGMSDMQQADNIAAGKTLVTETEHRQKLNLYKSAADAFTKAHETNKKMASASTYFIATCLYKMSLEQSALGDDAAAFQTIKRAIDIWPELNEVPASKFVNEQRIKVDGKRETYQALGTAEDWQHAYFQSYVRAMQLSNTLKNYDEAIKYATFILDEADTLQKEIFIAQSELSKAHKGKNDNCRSSEFAMRAIETALRYNTEKPADKEILSSYLDEVSVNVSPAANCRYNNVKWAEQAALALAKLHYKDDRSFYVLQYGQDAYNRGRHSTELLVALAEAEYYQNNGKNTTAKAESTSWMAEVDKRKKDFRSDELRRVANLYKLQGNKELEKAAITRAKRLSFWENTHFAVSTNPANFYWGQYLGAFELMLPRQSHEFRVNYNTNSTHLFWKHKDDKTPGNVYFMFSGYELSYTLKFMEKDMRGSKSKQFYSGPQFRFENREYKPTEVKIARNNNTHNSYTKTVDARSDRYEALFMVGLQRRTKWFFSDSFFGIGAGYKSFTNTLGADERAMDDRFRQGLWNKMYIPLHAGIRLGIIFK